MFGNYQQVHLGYPIGLIESSWGGTFIEPWSTPEGLETCEIPPDHQKQDWAKNSYLFNAMIHPLMKLSIEGAIWYQGENNGIKTIVDYHFHFNIECNLLIGKYLHS